MIEMSEKLWHNVARKIVKAGTLPFPLTETLMDLLKILITEEQAKFINLFRKTSMNLIELKERTDMDEESITKMLTELMDNGIITGARSRRTGIMVYYLLPPFPGLFEMSLIRGETGEKEKKLAKIYDKIFGEIGQVTQREYDFVFEAFKKFPPLDRVVPVEEEIEPSVEVVLPLEELTSIVENHDVFSVAKCYCRHQKDLLGRPCSISDERYNCVQFGKTAQHLIDYNFAKEITKEEALEILHKAEDDGYVHKAVHAQLNIEKGLEGFCNCCKCCCGVFELYYRNVGPIYSRAYYISDLNEELCVACGTCTKFCPTEAIKCENPIAVIDKERCIGCGLCAHHCPEKAIKLTRTGPRDVYIPPPKMTES
jgi:Pyruvate/2-oxoacid:ferredoxin oxidoreductase delta subunit